MPILKILSDKLKYIWNMTCTEWRKKNTDCIGCCKSKNHTTPQNKGQILVFKRDTISHEYLYSSPLPTNTNPLIVKYYQIVTLKRGNPSYKTTFSLQKGWLYKKGTTVLWYTSYMYITIKFYSMYVVIPSFRGAIVVLIVW